MALHGSFTTQKMWSEFFGVVDGRVVGPLSITCRTLWVRFLSELIQEKRDMVFALAEASASLLMHAIGKSPQVMFSQMQM